MKVLRSTCGICLVIGIIGSICILALPALPFEDRLYECILGLLTGLISGAFLATATSFCELKIKVRRQKTLLKGFCLELSGCLKQLMISFYVSRDNRLSPRLFSPNLNCMKSPGLQIANFICSEIDENLFVRREKLKALNALRSMPSILYPKLYSFDCTCKILENKAQIIDLERQKPFVQYELVDVLVRELEEKASNLVDEIILFANENLSMVDESYTELFGKKAQKILRSQLDAIATEVTPQIEGIIRSAVSERKHD